MPLWTPLCSRLSGPVSAPWRRRLRAPDSHYLCNVSLGYVKDLAVSTSCFARPPRADPRVHHRTFSHVLRLRTLSHVLRVVWETSHTLRKTPLPPGTVRGGQRSQSLIAPALFSARLATLSSAWSWIPPFHVWSTFARRWVRLVVGVFASKVCTANGVLHLSSGFALLGFPRSCTRLLWIIVFPLPGCSSAETLFESVPAAVPAVVWLCASWSAGTSRRRHARID